MCVLLFDLLPEFLNRVVVRRIGGQLEDLQPGSLLGKERFGLGTGVIPRSILNEDDRARGVPQYPLEKGNVRRGVEAAFLALIKEAPGKVLNQPEDFVAFTLARGFDL